jgi:tRNA 2-selenouridine synthase
VSDTPPTTISNSSEYNPELYRELLCDGIPLLDVRAPVEFSHGAFPRSANRPLLDDEQRRLVGISYKEHGQGAAIALGETLLNNKLRSERVAQWADWIECNPNTYLYCFRGGLRSQIVQEWLQEAGISCPRVPGGYKAMRRFLLESIDAIPQQKDIVLIAGATGSGKTEIIEQLPNAADLEGHARHRGSAFGNKVKAQPSQINFENGLAIDLLKLPSTARTLYLEDEGQAIGSLSVPITLYAAMKKAPIVHIDEPVDTRAKRILNDYIINNLQDFEQQDPLTAFGGFREYLLTSLGKIQRRLGGERYQQIKAIMESALTTQEVSGATEQHSEWIDRLLRDYYDPMYLYQLKKNSERIIFKGNTQEFWSWHKSSDTRPRNA